MKHPRLEWYIVIVEAGSISKAASILFASQQALSSYIKRLEMHYNIVLFDRNQGFSLTPQGNYLYEYAKKIVAREQRLLNEYQAIREGHAGRIRFGLSIARSQLLLPKIIPVFREHYPNVKLLPTEVSTASLVNLLAERKIDIYYGKDFDTLPHISKEILLRERLYLIVTDDLLRSLYLDRAAEVSAQFRNGVWLRQTVDFPFVGIDSTGKVDRRIDAYCQKNEITLNNVIQANNTPLLIDLCMKSLGAGLCPEAFLPQVIQLGRDNPSGRLNIYPVLDDIGDWNVVLAYYPSDDEASYTSYFKELIRNYAFCKRSITTRNV